MANEMKLKAHQLLSQLQGRMLARIQQEARNKAEYCQEKPEEALKWMEYIANPEKWDYCGILDKDDKKVLETIEYLLNDDATEIRRYKEWKPMER